MSVTGVSTIIGLESSTVMGRCDNLYPSSYTRQPLLVQMHVTTWLLCPKISITRASIISVLASWILQGQWIITETQSTYRQALSSKELLTILRLHPTIDRPWSVNTVAECSASYTPIKCSTLFQNGILRGQCSQSVLVHILTIIHAMSHRSNLFASSNRANIWNLHSTLL